MAKPQLENGYFKMSNELFEALIRTRVPGEARQVLDAIIRKTYGYNKKADFIPLSQLCKMTSLSRSHVCTAIKKLVSMNIISPEKGTGGSPDIGTGQITKYMINKDYDTWVGSPKKGTGSPNMRTGGSPEKGNTPVPNSGHSKDILQKTRNKDTMAHPLLVLFGQLFEERFKSKYVATFDVDTKILKDVVKAIGQEEAEKRIRRFFEDDDDFLTTTGHTVKMFKSRVNKYCDTARSAKTRGGAPVGKDVSEYDNYRKN